MHSACLTSQLGSSGRVPEPVPRRRVLRQGVYRTQRRNRRARARARAARRRARRAGDGDACVRDGGGRARDRQDAPARELRARAEERGFLVLAGSATEFERDLPFSVWVDALDAYVASLELGLDARGASSRWTSWPRSSRPSGRAPTLPARPSPQSATAPTGRFADCSSCSRGSARSSSSSTTCTGATTHRSSCSPP